MAKKHFKAESKRLLDLMINSIYTNREIFLREIISNANDALDKLRYLSLTDESARAAVQGELSITVAANKEERTVTVIDNGIGMSLEELENNLGTICKSGSLAFKNGIPEDDSSAANIIGQFGVGFYSAFMVAQKVQVFSRKYNSDVSYLWESTGADGYTVSECEKTPVGTKIVMFIKPDSEQASFSEFLEDYRLKNLIKTYSDYIRYPINMILTKTKTEGEGENAKVSTYLDSETVNSMVPVWKKSKAEATEEEYNKYYKDTFFDTENPLMALRVSTEGLVSYNALLFVPAAAPYNYYTKDYKKGLKLYSGSVMIMENCEDLLPEHFRFVKGVVESDDISLNISREMLQQDRQMKTVAASIEKKICAELKKMLAEDREKYEKFFKEFGLQLKYGVAADYGINMEKLRDLLLFYSLNSGKLVTLNEYVEAMPQNQEHIYYACGESLAKIAALPQTELVKAKNFDMLCLVDDADEFIVQLINKVGEKDFCSINSENSGLQDESANKAAETAGQENKEMLDFLKESIEGVHSVVISKKLKSHPVCLSSSGDVTLEMEKYFMNMPSAGPKPKAERVLELNSAHPAFEALKNAYATDKPRAAKIGKVLYNQALLIAGFGIENTAEYTDLVCELIK